MPELYAHKIINSPVGTLKLVADDDHLLAVLWPNDNPRRVRFAINTQESNAHPILHEAEKQLNEYFRQERNSFSIPLRFIGTPFQQAVWDALNQIPFGETRSYKQIAVQVNCPKGTQAVGGANGRNPLSIIVPCHRVIGANGTLTGFAGGLEVKTYLLELESKSANPPSAQLQLEAASVP